MERQHWTWPERDVTQMWSNCYNNSNHKNSDFLYSDMTNVFLVIKGLHWSSMMLLKGERWREFRDSSQLVLSTSTPEL